MTLRAPDEILAAMSEHGLTVDDFRHAVDGVPLWKRDQIQAATGEALHEFFRWTAADSELTGAIKKSAGGGRVNAHMIAGMMAIQVAIVCRKRWSCPHHAKALRTGFPDRPFFAALTEGVTFCRRPRCVEWGFNHLEGFIADDRCDICDRVPPDGYTPIAITFGPLQAKFNACFDCSRFYKDFP